MVWLLLAIGERQALISLIYSLLLVSFSLFTGVLINWLSLSLSNSSVFLSSLFNCSVVSLSFLLYFPTGLFLHCFYEFYYLLVASLWLFWEVFFLITESISITPFISSDIIESANKEVNWLGLAINWCLFWDLVLCLHWRGVDSSLNFETDTYELWFGLEFRSVSQS